MLSKKLSNNEVDSKLEMMVTEMTSISVTKMRDEIKWGKYLTERNSKLETGQPLKKVVSVSGLEFVSSADFQTKRETVFEKISCKC